MHAIEKDKSALSSKGLQLFFNQWHVINTMEKPDIHLSPLADQLQSFFDEWRRCKYTTPISPLTEIKIDAGNLEQFFEKFNKAWPAVLEMRLTGTSANVWKAAGLKRDELRNSAVLAWLLDCHGEHGQGNAIMKCLLQSLSSRYPDENFPKEGNAEKNYWTRTESCPLGEQESRVDIEIEGLEFLLLIEIKIDASETNDQLTRYLEIGKSKAQKKPWCVLYLTRDGHTPDRFANEHYLVPIKWKWVASILEAYTKDQSSFASHSIRQFADHIRMF